jgi:hypothetical protein
MSCEWTPEQFNLLPTITHGDTTPEAIRVTISDDHGTLSAVELIVKTSADAGSSSLELKSADEQITITTATAGAWDFRIEKFEATPAPGDYVIALRTTNTDGEDRTWIEGVWTVTPKI